MKWHMRNHVVLFRECDLTGNVYHPNCFKWFEDSRFQIAKEARLLQELKTAADIFYPVIESKCKFIIPLQVGMDVIIKTRLDPPKVAKLVFHHTVVGVSGIKYAEGKTVVAIVSKKDGLLTKIDTTLQRLIESYLAS